MKIEIENIKDQYDELKRNTISNIKAKYRNMK